MYSGLWTYNNNLMYMYGYPKLYAHIQLYVNVGNVLFKKYWIKILARIMSNTIYKMHVDNHNDRALINIIIYFQNRKKPRYFHRIWYQI